jgi:hypothetical protein
MLKIYFEDMFDDMDDFFEESPQPLWGDNATPLTEVLAFEKEADLAWKAKNYDRAIDLYEEVESKYAGFPKLFEHSENEIIQNIRRISRKLAAVHRSKKRAELMKKINEKHKEQSFQEAVFLMKKDIQKTIIREAKKKIFSDISLPLELKKEKFINEILSQDDKLVQSLTERGIKTEEISSGLRQTVENFAQLDKELTKILSSK